MTAPLCKHSHPLVYPNVRIYKGRMVCLKCERASNRKHCAKLRQTRRALTKALGGK